MRAWIREVTSQITAWAIIGLMGLLGVWLASLTPMIAAYAPFSYLAAFLLILVAAAIALLLIGKAKREWWPPTEAATPIPAPYDDAELRAALTALEAKALEAIQSLEEAVEENEKVEREHWLALNNKIDAVASEGRAYAKGVHDGLIIKIASEAGERAGLGEALSQRLDEHRSILIGHDGALSAIYHRERMLALTKGIDAKSLELGVPLADGKVMDEQEWESWQSERRQWESTVHQWANYARIYLGREPMDDIKRINSEGLDEDWGAKADQFPDPEGLRIYKTFRIYLRNYAGIRDVVHEKVRRKAFEGVDV